MSLNGTDDCVGVHNHMHGNDTDDDTMLILDDLKETVLENHITYQDEHPIYFGRLPLGTAIVPEPTVSSDDRDCHPPPHDGQLQVKS
jgi:hypothetical protein